jgi:hypothetical protein
MQQVTVLFCHNLLKGTDRGKNYVQKEWICLFELNVFFFFLSFQFESKYHMTVQA